MILAEEMPFMGSSISILTVELMVIVMITRTGLSVVSQDAGNRLLIFDLKVASC